MIKFLAKFAASSMDLANMPDEWLLDIFIHVDFVRQFRLRRCCQKWRKMLQSKCRLRTILLTDDNDVETPPGRLESGRISYETAISSIQADVQEVICTGEMAWPPSKNPMDPINGSCAWHILHILAIHDNSMPKRRLTFANVPRVPYSILYNIWEYRGISSMELRNVGIAVKDMWNFRPQYKLNFTSMDKYVKCPWDGQAALIIVKGGSCRDCLALRNLLEVSCRWPTESQMRDIERRRTRTRHVIDIVAQI